ncbi:MAG: sulfatase-like hydrolase/transferase, partial [Planctomycetota bacterium]
QAYFGMVACIDDNVGRIITRLMELGLLDRTILVFTSDHGDLCYEHGRLNKGIPYEASAKVPMLIAAPGMIRRGTRIDASWSNVDFAPTILRLLLGEKAEEHSAVQRMEGSDLTALLTQTTSDMDTVSFLRSASDKPGWMAAVTDRHKLVFSVSDEPWLFDLEKDPNELENQFGDAEYAPIVQRLTKALLAYGKKWNDSQLQGNSPLVSQLQGILP